MSLFVAAKDSFGFFEALIDSFLIVKFGNSPLLPAFYNIKISSIIALKYSRNKIQTASEAVLNFIERVCSLLQKNKKWVTILLLVTHISISGIRYYKAISLPIYLRKLTSSLQRSAYAASLAIALLSSAVAVVKSPCLVAITARR